MPILDIFRPRGLLSGRIAVCGLPAHLQNAVDIAVLRVGSIPRFPAQYRDVLPVKTFEEPPDKPLAFHLRRPAGEYYVAVNLWVLFQRAEKMEAQTEWLFPMKQPIRVGPGAESFVELSVTWPEIPADQLLDYGTIRPDGRFTPPNDDADCLRTILLALRGVEASQVHIVRDGSTGQRAVKVILRKDQFPEVLRENGRYVREAAIATGTRIGIELTKH